MATGNATFGQNSVLAALSKRHYEKLSSHLKPVRLTFGEALYEMGQTIDYVYFPTDGIVSLLISVDHGHSAQVALVGPEGFAGGSTVLGFEHSPFTVIVQGSGSALRIEAQSFKKQVSGNPEFQRAVHRFIQRLMFQIAQNAGCNQFHSVSQRLARLLLTTSDCMHSNHIHLTQHFLGRVLGVPRGAISFASNRFRQRRLIGYQRGEIRILNRAYLEVEACRCYKAVSGYYLNSKLAV